MGRYSGPHCRAGRSIRRVAFIVFIVAAWGGLGGAERASDPPAGPRSPEVMWRFDGGGRFPDIHPPTEWAADKNILWKTVVGIGGYSSPIVVGDKVFVTAEMGSLLCLDLSDGKILWQKDLFSKGSADIPAELSKELMRGCGGNSKQSTPTPASDGRRVFYINAMGLCVCYDMRGNRLWVRVVETAKDEEHFSASPIFHGDRVVLSWGCLLALDAKDGHTLWRADDAKPTHGTPTIAKIGGVEVVVTPAGDIVRLSDGQVLCSELFESTYTTPLVEGDVLYVVDANALAFRLPAPEKGMRPTPLWKTGLTGEFMASPIYRDGLLYTFESQRARLHILDAATGAPLVTTRVEDEKTKAVTLEPGVKIAGLAPGRYAYASPVASDRQLYFFDDVGNAALLAPGREYKPLRINKLPESVVGSPFFVGDRIILRGKETLYCIGEKH
jgi:outer membrane protein assembly factor BamB